MGLTACKECGGKLSTAADQCPHCGHKISRTSVGTLIIGGIFALVVGSCIVGQLDRDSATELAAQQEAGRVAALAPQQGAAEAKRKAAELAQQAKEKKLDLARYACETFVKKTLHDPDSAEFAGNYWAKEERPGIYYVQVGLRAKNGFNALRKDIVDCHTTQDKQGNWFALALKQRDL